MTEFPIVGLRSVAFGLPDPVAAARFYVAAWGLVVAAEQDGVICLRGTGLDHHLLSLHQAPAPVILSISFRAASRAALDLIAVRAVAAGGQLLHGVIPSRDAAGGVVLALRDPWGGIIRVVHGDRTHSPLPPDDLRPERLAHVNINSVDVDALRVFFEEGLGFRLTDRSAQMAFVRTNADHHAVVIAQSAANGLNHVAFQLPRWESVMLAAGRMIDAGYPIAWGVGRHGPGDNIFAYFIGPAQFVIEYTAEVLQVDDDYPVGAPADWVWPPGRTDQWGIAPPKSEACKQAQSFIRFAPADRVAAGYEG